MIRVFPAHDAQLGGDGRFEIWLLNHNIIARARLIHTDLPKKGIYCDGGRGCRGGIQGNALQMSI